MKKEGTGKGSIREAYKPKSSRETDRQTDRERKPRSLSKKVFFTRKHLKVEFSVKFRVRVILQDPCYAIFTAKKT